MAPVEKSLQILKKEYPNAHCALDHKNPFELLIATILSAQCTDDRVNKVTPALFKKYPDAASMAKAPVLQIEKLIQSTGFFRNKARNIKQCSQMLVKNYKGEIPQNIDQLTELPGVGRKTANVVLGNAFDITSGIVVDTHVTRISRLLGWSSSNNAEAIEKDLIKIIPKKYWIIFSHWLIWHGRAVCKARSPQCSKCCLADLCPSRFDS